MKKALTMGSLLLLFLFVSEGFHLLKLFPFDASFVNLILAQNMADSFRFAFNPGELSAGSDSPLYPLILSLFFKISIDPFAASAVLGKFLFAGCGLLIWQLVLRFSGDSPRSKTAAFLAAMLWFSSGAAGFNMASGLGGLTLAFTGLCLMLLLLEPDAPGALVGLTAALTVLSQPAGWLIAGIALWVFRTRNHSDEQEGKTSFRMALLAFAVPVLPWVLFCISQNGTIFPNPTAATLDSAAARPGEFEFIYQWAAGTGPQSIDSLYRQLTGQTAGQSWFKIIPWAAVPVLWSLAVNRLKPAGAPALYILLHLIFSLAGIRRTGEVERFFMLDLAFVYILGVLMIVDISERLERRSPLLAAATIVLPVLAVFTIQTSGALYYQSVYNGLNMQISQNSFSMAHWINGRIPGDAVVATYEPGIVRFVSGRTVLDLTGRVESHALEFRGRDLDSLIAGRADYVIDPGFMSRLGFSPEDSTLYEEQDFPFQQKLYRVLGASSAISGQTGAGGGFIPDSQSMTLPDAQ